MWKVSVCLLLVSIHVNHIRANGVGWGSGDSGSSQAANTQYNSGRDTSIASLPQYENSPGTATNENYWWLTANPFQKPPNHPGVEKGASSGSTAPGPSNSNYGATPNSPVISYNPSNQPNSQSYGPSNSFPQQQRPNPTPQIQQAPNTGSYGGASAPGNGWSGPSNPSINPQASPSSPGKPNQNYKPPIIDFDADCQLTNKADCHAGATPVINPGYNQVDTPSLSNNQKYPEIGASSYTQPKPQVPVTQNLPSDNSYGNSPPGSYSPQNSQPAPQYQSAPQIPANPTPQIQPLPQAKPSSVGPSYQVLPSTDSSYSTGSSPYGSPASKPVVQPQPSYSNSGSGWSAPTPLAGSPLPNNNFPVQQQKPSYTNSVSSSGGAYNPVQPSSSSSGGAYNPAQLSSSSSGGAYNPVQPSPQTVGNSGQYQPKPYNPAANNVGQANPPPFNYRPAPPAVPTGNANNNNYGDQLPYPGCPAAMLCVPDNRCNAIGVIEEKPIVLSPAEQQFRVALVACSAPSTGEVGVCCRDPNYKDPWPDMNGNGGNKQHHHHHQDDSSQGSGGFSPGNSQQGATHQLSQPSQNFNSYSDVEKTENGEQFIRSVNDTAENTSLVLTNEEKTTVSSIGEQEFSKSNNDDNNDFELRAKDSPDDGGLPLQFSSPIIESQAAVTATDSEGVQVHNDNVQDAKSNTGKETIRLQLFSKVGGQTNKVELPRLNNNVSDHTPSSVASSFTITLQNSVGSDALINTNDESFETPDYGNATNHAEVTSNSRVTITDVPLDNVRTSNAKEDEIKVANVALQEVDSNESKLLKERNAKVEFLFPPPVESLLPVTKEVTKPVSPQALLKVQKKDKIEDQIIIDLESAYKARTFVARVQNGSSPFGQTPTSTTSTTTTSTSTPTTNPPEITTTIATSNPIEIPTTTIANPTRIPTTTEKPTPSFTIEQIPEVVQTFLPPVNSFTSPTATTNPAASKQTTARANVNSKDRSKSHLYPFYPGMLHSRSFVTSDNGEQIEIPSQRYETPTLTTQDRLRFILPPRQDDEADETTDGGAGEIQFFSPLASKIVDECPQNMKCLSEAYCSNANPAEGDADAFDIRLHFRKKTHRHKCRQPNLPTNGVCCYLRDDFASVPTSRSASDNNNKIQKNTGEKHCGIRRPNLQKPNETEVTSFGEFPWQALIFRKNESSCGGVILSERLIATSASCIVDINLEDIVIRVGDWDADNVIEPKLHQEHYAEDLFVHPGFKTGPLYTFNDLAIIRTMDNITFDYHVSRICLPNAFDRFEGQRCIATGWYTTTPDNIEEADFSPELKQMPVIVAKRNICEQKLRETKLGSRFHLHSGHLCAMGDPNIKTCVVEPGGPLICENGQTGSYTLVGIFGWGNPCGNSDEVGVYVNTPAYIDWIYSVIQRDSAE